MKYFVAMLTVLSPVIVQADETGTPEFTAEQMALYLDRACFSENPKRFLRRSGYLADIGWDLVEDDETLIYTSPGGGVTAMVDEGTIDAGCIWTIAQGAVSADFDAVATTQIAVDEKTGAARAPEPEGDGLLWHWNGSGAYMMQSYAARVMDSDEITIIWATE